MTELTGEGGKGSSPRPYSVSDDVFSLRHTLVFSRDEKEREQARKKLIEMGEIKE